jgi:hypothetical protein
LRNTLLRWSLSIFAHLAALFAIVSCEAVHFEREQLVCREGGE